jgi:hypothetical protein
VSLGRERGSRMDPNLVWILRPGGASLIRALVLACLVLPAGVAQAASGVPILQPDAPPSAAVVAPSPDPPAPTARAPVIAPTTVVRPTLRPETGAGTAHPAVQTRPEPAQTARSHAAKASTSASRRKPAAVPAVLRRGRLPDSVGAFLALRSTQAADGGLDRGGVALAGMLLAIVTLGGGCLTVAVGRVSREER